MKRGLKFKNGTLHRQVQTLPSQWANKDFTFPEIIWKVSVRQSVRLKTSSDVNDFFKRFYEGKTNCRIFDHGTFVLRSANVDGWPLVFWLLVVRWRVPSYWGFAARRSLLTRCKISYEIRRLSNERSRQGWPKSRIDNPVGHIFTANRNRDLGEDRFPVSTFEECEPVIQTEMVEVFLFTRQESTTPGKFLINNTAKTNSEKVYKIYDNLASKNEEFEHWL